MFTEIITEIKDFLSDYVVTEYNGFNEFTDSVANHCILKPSKKYDTQRFDELYTVRTNIVLYFYDVCNIEQLMNAYEVIEVNENNEEVSRELGIKESVLPYIKVVINYRTLKTVDSLCYSCS